MALGLLGTKVGMTQVYNEKDGLVEPVTVLQLGPCPVLQVRTTDRDGYSAVQLGYRDKPRKNAIRAEQGHVASSLKSKRKDARLQGGVQLLPKADVEPQRFIREFRVDAPGAKKVHRQAGSTSSLASNRGTGRPKKGMKRAGQYGNARITVRNLAVVRIDVENNLLLVRGAVPGHAGAYILVRPTNKFGSTHGIERVEGPAKNKVVLQKKGK
jgi:large subunit ribosomal protein L3